MTKSDLMKTAHAEARKFQAATARRSWVPVSYAEALSVGLRRAHNQAARARYVAAAAMQPKIPKFMFLRGL